MGWYKHVRFCISTVLLPHNHTLYCVGLSYQIPMKSTEISVEICEKLKRLHSTSRPLPSTPTSLNIIVREMQQWDREVNPEAVQVERPCWAARGNLECLLKSFQLGRLTGGASYMYWPSLKEKRGTGELPLISLRRAGTPAETRGPGSDGQDTHLYTHPGLKSHDVNLAN